MTTLTVDWAKVPVTRLKGVSRVYLDGSVMEALQGEAGCRDMRSAECRARIRDLALEHLREHHKLPVVKHDDHIWLGRRGDGWLLTFFTR